MLSTNNRLHFLTFVIIGIAIFLGARLAYIQIAQADYFDSVAESQRRRSAELAPHRGTIYLQERQSEDIFPVAVNTKAWTAYAVPRDIEDPLSVAQRLAPQLFAYRQRQSQRVSSIIASTGQHRSVELDSQPPSPSPQSSESPDSSEAEIAAIEQELYDKLNQRSDPYEPILKFYEVLDDELRSFLEEETLPGVVVEEQERRIYPENSLAAHVLGYVGWEESKLTGRYGIEGFFQELLSGSIGFFSGERDASGRLIGVGQREFTPSQDGSDLILTVDRVVQSIIEDELKDGVERYDAERGSVIVMDPNTGAVLGMATYPTYDPNAYYAINNARVQLNPTVSELFEPGSVLKPVIMAAAIEEDIVEPDTTFVDDGPVKVAEYTINTYDGQHHGVQTMTQVLEKSNNVGMVWVGQQLGAETTYDYLRRFGIGEKTGISLEGETQSSLEVPDDWDIAQLATTSFGQGVALTPLQALNAINVLANGGMLMQPHILARINHADGTTETTTPHSVHRVISPETADDISAMMVSVLENGVATLARVPGYYLAGKTGTAQVPDERGRYHEDKKIISFVGYGPVSKPRFSILIKLDNPAGLSFASGTAAPMFRNISEKLLNYYQIPPDYEVP